MSYREHFYSQYTDAQSRSTAEQMAEKVKHDKWYLKKTLLNHLPVLKNATIVDLGCGYGSALLMLQEEGYTNTSGVDISPQQVAAAQSLGARNVALGTLESVLEARPRVDCFIMMDVIEHLTRNEAIETLKAMHECLNAGGRIILRTPNIDAPLGTVMSFGDLTHELHLNVISTKELFASLPYSSVDILPLHPSGGPFLVRVLRALFYRPGMFIRRIQCAIHAVRWRDYIHTTNMLIVAQK
ncbi:MAG: class I SAM-dependent methyltransferase [bacterium]|nr:class I SAM-dependent methyltransferase [bacterium]